MPKQLNVNLSFTADTQQAKVQLQDLQNQLTKITANAGNSSLGLTQEISAAVVETTKLQTALQKATTSTGSLDLGAFRQELQRANLDAEKIASNLMSLGPEGQAAFAQLAQSVSLAEVPIRRTNGLLMEFATTLKNTARWQISSSILHGFMGSLQSAYRYAEDLNESLTNIRIVTGQSTDQMTEFAKQANKAAKELSTTTTAYTDAALIFYQQGLTGDDVTERTDTVIKMANVTGDSAEEVSSYMTAIWNNFDDGSESLEHYADVITALGANTASSSAEIAAGLEKFASVGETIGLTYDYATSALATVVASTRQSAESVGNGFRTIFTRLQGLKLGETLDDGTDLTKYSKALASVGVDIKTVDGELKDMDTILDELGARWGELSKDQQVALAQTVAGVRQYVNLVALMDNWDFMQRNVSIAKDANGSLQEQADIYAESWEAAQKRVKASMQAVYSQLLNDKFFIDLTNGMSTLVDTISNVIDALGGLKGILPMIGTLLIRAFGTDISNAINNTIYNIKLMTKSGREEIYQMRSAFVNNLKEMADESTVLGGAQKDVYTAQANVQENLLQKTIQLESAHRSLTDEEQKQLQLLLDINNNIGQQYLDLAKVREEEEAITNQLVAQARAKVQAANRKQTDSSKQYNSFNDDIEAAQVLQKQFTIGTNLVKDLNKELSNVKSGATSLESVTSAVKNLQESFEKTGVDVTEFKNELNAITNASSVDELETAIENLDKQIQKLGADAQDSFDNIAIDMEVAGVKARDAAIAVDGLQQEATKLGATEGQLATTQNNLNQNVEKTNEEINKLSGRIPTTADQFMALGQTIMSVSMVISSLSGIVDTLSDPDLTGWEKFVAILSAMGMMIPSLVMTTRSLTTVLGAQTIATEGATAAQWGLNIAMDANPVGAIILGLTALVGVVSIVATAYDSLTMSVKEAEEQLESLNQEMKNFSSSGSSIQNNIDELEDMEDEYDKLSSKAGEYDRNIDLLTESERQRYNEIKNAIANCNDASIAYYNDEGEAILKNNDMLRETIELLQEKYELERAEIYNTDFKDKNKAHDVEYKNAQTELSNAEEYKASFTESDTDYWDGKSYEETVIENMQSYNWSNIQTTLNDTSAQTEDTLEAMEELYTIIGNGTDAIIAAQKDGTFDEFSELFTQALTDAGFEGQAEYVQEYLDGIVAQAEEYQNMFEDASAEVEKAAVNAAAASNLDTSWVLGVVKYNKDNNDGYNLLLNAGIENADAYIASYVNGLKLGVNGINSYQDVYDAVNNFEEEIAQVFISHPDLVKNLDEAGEDFSKLTFTSYQDYCHQISEQINNILEDNPELKALPEKVQEAIFGSIFGTGNLSFDENHLVTGLDTKYSDVITKFREQLLSKVNEGAITPGEMIAINRSDITSFIPYDQLDNLDYIIDHIDEATLRTEGWKAAVQEVLDELELTEKYNDLTEQLGTANSAINLLTSDKTLTKKQIEELQSSLESLEDEYGELATIQDKSSQAYLNKLLEIREAIEEEQIAIKKQIEEDKIDEAIEISVKSNGGEDELQDKLIEICEADYEVLVEVKSDIQDDFDTVVNSMDSIESMASKIGDDFIVAAEDIEELNDIFPGILANMELVGDGTVKLNQEVVQSAMNAAKAEVAADTDKTIEKLQNQADELAARRDAARTIANIASSIVEGEAKADEVEGELDEALNQLKSDNSEATANQEQEDDKNVAETAAEASTSMAQSFGSAYEQMANDAVSWAATAHQAILAATDPNQPVPTVGTFGGASFQTTANVTTRESNKADLSSYEDYASVDDWQQVADYYNNLADSYDEAYNNVIGKIGELSARGQGLDKEFDNISKGLGSDGKKSGGKDKNKDTKDEKKYDDEFDRYHDINESLKELDHTMKMLSKEQEHLFGNELAASLRQENELIAQQTGLYEQKLAIQQQEQAELQAELAANGIAFDTATGEMLNYAEGTAQALKELNDAIKAYNASAQEEADKLVLEAAEKKYELFKKNLERYDALLAEIRTSQENIQDNYYKQLENELKAWNAEIQVKLDLAEARRTWHKFINTISKDFKSVFRDVSKDMASIVEQAKTFMGDNGTIAVNMNAAKEIMAEIDNMQAGGTSNKFASVSEAQEELKKYNEQLQDSAEELYQLYEDAWDAYIEGIEQAIDKFDDLIDQYDRINDDLDHQSKMIELLYGDQAYDLLGQLYGAQANNLLGEMDSLRQQIDFYKSQYEHAAATYGADSEAAQKWKESWESAISNLHGKEEDYIDAIKNQALNAITETFAALEKQLTGGDSLSWVSEQWEDALYAAEGYYDEVERIYQLESIEQKYKKAINDTSALKYQQQLKTLMDEQLSSLEGKTKLSEYDIELAEKRLAVYQAQIALEEAQNNKTSMKLTRGTDGNWSYQYVADDNDVMSKQEELLAKQQEYYEFTKQSWQDLTQKITEDTQTAIQRIQELEEESLTATTERQAEIAEQIEYLREYYWGEEGVITQEIAAHAEYENNLNQATAETLWALYETDLDNYSLMTDNEKALIDDLRDYGVTNFQTLYDAIAKNYDDIQTKCDDINAQSLNTWTTTANEMIRKWNSGDGDSIVYQVTQALSTCSQAVAQYAYMVQMGCAAAGENFANVGQMIQYDQQATAALEGQTQQLVGTTCQLLAQYEGYLAEVANMWYSVSAAIFDATRQIQQYLALQGIATSIGTPGTTSASSGTPAATSSNTGTGNKGTGTLDNDTAWGIATAIWTEGDSGWYNNPVRSERINEKFGDGAYEQVQSIINQHSANGDLYDYWKKNLGGDASQFHYSSFASGGYTGDWDGGDGRLAVLHSKELVLNENDTKNILSVVDSVRNIASLGGSITASIANGIGNMVSSLMGLGNNNKYNYNTNNNDGNNTFEITMNVDGGDVKEIQQAILNLPNLASQYLSRK